MWQHFDMRDHPSMRIWYQRVQSRPGWVWKATAITALVVVVVPILILVAAAVLAAAVVFTVLSLIARGVGLVRGLFTGGGSTMPSDRGRRNVRVRVRSTRFEDV